MNDLIIIMLPPFSEFKEAPKDQSASRLIDCPECKQKCWISEKKSELFLDHYLLKNEILMTCYHCITKRAKTDPDFFKNHEMRKI